MKVWLVGRNPGGLIPASCARPVSSSLAAQVLNTFVGLGIASIVGVATWGHPYQVQSDGQIVIGLALTVTAVTSVLLLVAGLNRGMAVKRFTKVSPRRAAPHRAATQAWDAAPTWRHAWSATCSPWLAHRFPPVAGRAVCCSGVPCLCGCVHLAGDSERLETLAGAVPRLATMDRRGVLGTALWDVRFSFSSAPRLAGVFCRHARHRQKSWRFPAHPNRQNRGYGGRTHSNKGLRSLARFSGAKGGGGDSHSLPVVATGERYDG